MLKSIHRKSLILQLAKNKKILYLEETETKDEILKSVGINLQEQKVTLFALLLFFLPRQVQQKNKKLF